MMSADPSMALTIWPRFFTANAATVCTARSSARSDSRNSVRWSLSSALPSATRRRNFRTVCSLPSIAATRLSSESRVATISPRWPPTSVAASDSFVIVSCSCPPWPENAASPASTNRRIASVVCFDPAIPVANWSIVSSTWSKSTGVRVESTAIVAPSFSFGPSW